MHRGLTSAGLDEHPRAHSERNERGLNHARARGSLQPDEPPVARQAEREAWSRAVVRELHLRPDDDPLEVEVLLLRP